VSEVEHGLRVFSALLLTIVVASLTPFAVQPRAETDSGFEQQFLQIESERDGESYLRQMEDLAGQWQDPRAWLALARYRYLVGAYRAAADDFQKAADRLSGEERWDARCWRAVSLLGAGEERAAVSLLHEVSEEAAGTGPGTRARFLAAQAEWAGGKPEAALRTVEPLLEGEHDYLLPALLLSARALDENGATALARERYATLLTLYPGSVEAEEALAHLRAAEKKERVAPGHYVQIAAFEVEENALRFVAEQSERGVGALQIHPAEDGDRTIFTVRVGPFSKAEEAERARENLAGQGVDGIVLEMREEE